MLKNIDSKIVVWFLFIIALVSISIVSAWTPPSNINMQDFYNITNGSMATFNRNVTASNFLGQWNGSSTLNTSMTAYVDAQDIIFNDSIKNVYVDVEGDTMTGNLNLANTIDIIPVSAGGSDLGAATKPFGNFYLANWYAPIFPLGTGSIQALSIDGSDVAINVLNDFIIQPFGAATDSDLGGPFGTWRDIKYYRNLEGKNIDITGNLTVNTDNLFVDSSTGRVGIGTATPQQKLNVIGDGNFTGNLIVDNNITTTDSILINSNDTYMWFGDANNIRMGFNSTSNCFETVNIATGTTLLVC